MKSAKNKRKGVEMKRRNVWKKWTASVMALAMTASLGACVAESASNPPSEPTPEAEETLKGCAYLAIDINPSLEIVVEDGEVTDIYAVNDDASVLLSGEDFIGLTTEDAVKEIVELAEEMGYLNTDNTVVKLTVASDDEEYAEEVETDATEGAESGSEIADVNNEPRSADDRTCKKLKEKDPERYKGLTPAKVRLIEAIMRYDESITFEVAVEMEFSELMATLRQYVEEYGALDGEQLKQEYHERKQALKEEKEREIAALYGEEYLAKWERVQALKKAVLDLERSVEQSGISSAHAEAIQQLLSLTDLTEISEDEQITVEEIDEYLDKRFLPLQKKFGELKDVLAQVKNSLQTILENYDKDAYALTADDLAALAEVWGEEVQATTLADLKAFVKAQIDALEEIKEELQETLTQEQLEEIEQTLETVKEVKDQVRKNMEEMIEHKKNEFSEEKQEKAGKRGGERK